MTSASKLTRAQFEQLLVNQLENEFQDMELGLEQLEMVSEGGLFKWIKKVVKKQVNHMISILVIITVSLNLMTIGMN